MVLIVKGVANRIFRKHLPGEHDQVAHGSWATSPTTIMVRALDREPDKEIIDSMKRYVEHVSSASYPEPEHLVANAKTLEDVFEHVPILKNSLIKPSISYNPTKNECDAMILFSDGEILIELDARTPRNLTDAIDMRTHLIEHQMEKPMPEEYRNTFRQITELLEGVKADMKEGRELNYYEHSMWASPNTYDMSLRHELGHYVHYICGREVSEHFGFITPSDSLISHYRTIDTARNDATAKYAITRRGEDNWRECVAENFTLYSIGKTEHMHPDMVALFDKLTTYRKGQKNAPGTHDQSSHGSWSEGRETIGEEKTFKEKFGLRHVDFTGSAPGHAREAMKGFEKAATMFPFLLKETARSLGIRDFGLIDNAAFDRPEHRGSFAIANNNGIAINPKVMGDVAFMWEAVEYQKETHGSPEGCEGIQGAIAHEVGHFFERWLDEQGDGSVKSSPAYQFQQYYRQASKTEKEALSTYSATTYHEAFAEAFSANLYGTDSVKEQPMVKLVGSLMEQYRADKSKYILDIIEEAKHMSGYHDQSTHGNRFGAPDERGNRNQTHVGRSRLEQVIRGMRVRDPAHDAELERQRNEQLKEPKKPAKYPGSKKLHREIDTILERHAKRVEVIGAKIDAGYEEADKLGKKWLEATKMYDSAVEARMSNDDKDALSKRADSFFEAYNVKMSEVGVLKREANQYTKEANAEIIEKLTINNEVTLPYKHGGWVSRLTTDAAGSRYVDGEQDEPAFDNEYIAPGIDFACKMVNPELLGDTNKAILISHGQIGKREHYMKNTISANEATSLATIVHEMGHAIEDRSPEVHQSCIEFYQKRTQGEKLEKLNSIVKFSNYESYEVARKDKFLDPYMGKEYVTIKNGDNDRYATELLSMGLQYLYQKPMALYRDDPEYFDWLVNTIRGVSEDD
jgi:hypothetical protein